MPVTIQLGGQVIQNAELLVRQYEQCKNETGRDYLDLYVNPNVICPEDLAMTLLMNSQVRGLAFRTLTGYRTQLEAQLAGIPQDVPLERASESLLNMVADMIASITEAGRQAAARRAQGLQPLANGIMVSIGTKLLHKKRPSLIPVLDAEAIFRDYVGIPAPDWGQAAIPPVLMALKKIRGDLQLPQNIPGWAALGQQSAQPRTRVQLFDMVWWQHNYPIWVDAGRRNSKQCSVTPGVLCPNGC